MDLFALKMYMQGTTNCVEVDLHHVNCHKTCHTSLAEIQNFIYLLKALL